jgi:hypothetical protein
MSHLEPLKIRNSNDGRPNKARSDTIRDLADKKLISHRRWNRFTIQ